MPQPAIEPVLTRGHKKKERTRQHLMAAAVDVIAERGEAFTISDVTSRAGVANGTFYNYFNDREQLIEAIVPEALAAFADESAIAVPDDDPAVRFATISALALNRAETSPDAITVVLRVDVVQQALIDGEVVGHLRNDLRAGAASGRFAFRDADAALDVITGALLMAARRIVEGHVDHHYNHDVLRQLLHSLGLGRDEADSIAEQAVTTALALDDQT